MFGRVPEKVHWGVVSFLDVLNGAVDVTQTSNIFEFVDDAVERGHLAKRVGRAVRADTQEKWWQTRAKGGEDKQKNYDAATEVRCCVRGRDALLARKLCVTMSRCRRFSFGEIDRCDGRSRRACVHVCKMIRSLLCIKTMSWSARNQTQDPDSWCRTKSLLVCSGEMICPKCRMKRRECLAEDSAWRPVQQRKTHCEKLPTGSGLHNLPSRVRCKVM